MTSLRSEDSGIENGNVRRPSAVSFSHDPEGVTAPIGREFSHATNNQFVSSNDNNNNNNRGDSPNHSIISKDGINYHGAAATSSNHGGTNSPSRSRRTVLREIIAAVRANREILVDSFLKTSAAYSVAAAAASGTPSQSSIPGTANNNQSPHNNNKDSDEGPHDEYPLWIPSFYASPDHRLPAQRVVTANKPNAMRNRALASMAIALSTLEIEMNEGTPLSASQNTGAHATVATDNINLPTALQNSPQATSKASQALAMCPTSPVMPSDEQHPNKPTRRLAPITVEDVIINGRVPLDLLSQSMITLFEAQDIFQKCIAANPVLEGKFEVKVAPASVLLVDTEDDWGTNFEVAPRRLAYKASELEEALSDVLRRRGVAICFFDKKALLEGMKQDDAGGEDEDDDDESNPAKKNLHALLNAPLNEDGSFANEDEGANAHSVGNLFNGSFTGIGGGRGAPVAMQALRTRRTDIREADCGFVLGPTRQAESVALAVTKWNRERDELELVYTEVTATALLDAMAMRNVKTGRPRGFVALMPLQELTINVPEINKSMSNNSPSQSSAQSPQDACFSISINNNASASGTGPGISALEVVASSAVTHDCIFPAFATLAQYHADEIEANAAISAIDKKTTVRIPLGHIDHSIATHVTCCAVGSALISGTLDKGLPINEIVNTVNMSDVHMSIESDDTLHVHEVFSYMLQYSLKTQAAQLDVEWCPVVQLVHRANAAATVSVEQLCETLQQVRNASNITEDNLSASLKKPMDVSMIVKVRIDIAIGTHGNSLNGTSGGTRWLVVCGYDEDTSMVHVLDPAPKRFGLFWSVSVEQLHRALTGHGYIILANKRSSVGKSAADFIVARPETNQICLQAGISYDSPDLILPTHSQLPPRPIARCPLSLAACAISRISNRNVTFSQFLRSLPHPAPYGFTEDISLAHFAHVTRTFCHEENLRVKMTLCHLSVDAQGVRAVDENQFSQRLASAAASPQHAVIVNYSVAGFTSCVRADRGTGSFALLLGFIPQDGKYNRYDRVLLQDCSDFTSQQVFSVEVNELYRACCDVCSVSRRTMGFIDLRYVEETEMLSPVGSLQSVPSVGDCVSSVPSGAMSVVSANREQNVSIALEGTLATSNWEAIAVSNHPELPRHMFKSPAIPVFTATSAALVSLGIVCAESDIVAANFGKSAENTKYEYLPTVLQAKPPTLAVAREMIEKYLAASSANAAGTGLTLLAAEKTNLLTALQAMAKHPRDVRVILQYDCRVVHSTIRKFVSAGVVSAVKGSGEGAFIRVLEAETASFLDVWEAKALSLMKTFDGQQQQGSGIDSSSSSSVPITGVLVLYRPGQVDEALFTTQPPNVTVGNNSSTAGSQAPRPPAINPSMNESAIGGGNLITSPPASPLLHHRPPQQEGGATGAAGSMRSKAMPYSLNASGKK